MITTRVKICGITRLDDALHAAAIGVDAIGLVFYDKSPRAIRVEAAAKICAELPAFVTTVALVKDAEDSFIRSMIRDVQVDYLQFHGSEDSAFCESFGKPYIKALGIADASDSIKERCEAHPKARGVLIDSHAPGSDGGTGECFDWSMIPDELDKPLILAGGLNVDNVADAVRQVRPYAVDVSSGVESDRGIKDQNLMTRFMMNVREACREA